MVDMYDGLSLAEQFASRAEFHLPAESLYIYAESVEERSHLPPDWSEQQPARFVKIIEGEFEDFVFYVEENRIQLRSNEQVDGFLDGIFRPDASLYLDITGLSHHVWAPLVSRLVRYLLNGEDRIRFRVVYVEPKHYRKSAVPRPGDIFALSERCHGIRPLPGFAKLGRRYVDAGRLVALLGFEGWRFEAILSSFEPDAGSVIPILGVPGFRAEYPFFTLEGNYLPLDKDDNWTRRRFATANDPFEVFSLLRGLATPDSPVRIAMVGTKPHSLGAVLFATVFPELGELVYDNPIRSAGRTDESRRVQVYDIASFTRLLSASPS